MIELTIPYIGPTLVLKSLITDPTKLHMRGLKNGDVLLFVGSLALLDFIYEARPDAVQGAMLRKGMGVLRGEGFKDT